MNANKIILTSLALASLTFATSFADETSTGTIDTNSGVVVTSEISTGTTSTGVTSTGTIVGNNKDEHGCIASAGYSWNSTLNQCIRPWELANSGVIIENRDEILKNREQIQTNWSAFHEEYGFIKEYLAKPANKEEAKKIAESMKTDIKAYHEAIKAILKEGKELIKNNTFDKDIFNQKLQEAFSKHTETLLKYVDKTKVEAFVAFMTAKSETLKANKELRIKNQELINENKEIKKKFLSEKQQAFITKKIEKKTEVYYTKLIEKINKLLPKIKNETLKGQLEELKEMTQEKLNALTSK